MPSHPMTAETPRPSDARSCPARPGLAAFGRAAGILALLAGGPAFAAPAQDGPLLAPSRDVAVTYRLSADGNSPPEAVVHAKAGGMRLRIEPAGWPVTLLVDRTGGEIDVLIGQHAYVQTPLQANSLRFLQPEARASFTRRGQETVLGRRCTEWDLRAPEGTGRVCATADGVILRAEGTDRQGRHGAAEAVAIRYAPEPEADFAPPPGAVRLALPAALLDRVLSGNAPADAPGDAP